MQQGGGNALANTFSCCCILYIYTHHTHMYNKDHVKRERKNTKTKTGEKRKKNRSIISPPCVDLFHLKELSVRKSS